MLKSFNRDEVCVSIRDILEVLEAKIIIGESKIDSLIEHVYISNMMSRILAYGKPNSILLTSIAARQCVISAHMAEFKGVVFLDGKIPQDGSIQFGAENELILLSSPFGIHEAGEKISTIINENIPSTQSSNEDQLEEAILLKQDYPVYGGDFTKAGMVSTDIKSTLRKIGFDANLIRRVAIATYEAEMNVVTHAMQGKVSLMVTPKTIEIIVDDQGKGIPDIDLAMQEGYTTATPEIQAMGFGSGMGLPNIRKNADELKILSEVNKGTKLIIRFHV